MELLKRMEELDYLEIYESGSLKEVKNLLGQIEGVLLDVEEFLKNKPELKKSQENLEKLMDDCVLGGRFSELLGDDTGQYYEAISHSDEEHLEEDSTKAIITIQEQNREILDRNKNALKKYFKEVTEFVNDLKSKGYRF